MGMVECGVSHNISTPAVQWNYRVLSHFLLFLSFLYGSPYTPLSAQSMHDILWKDVPWL